MRTLVEIFASIGNNTGIDIGCNDKGGIHTYLETYDKLFAPFQKGCTIMEIGLANGDSLKLWDEYFTNSIIFGLDISLVFEPWNYKNKVALIEENATDPHCLWFAPNQTFDIIIDDGSHMENDQVTTFNLLKGKMKPGGIYIIEDILSLDTNRKRFEGLHSNCEIIDMRHVNNRFDNILIIYRF